MLTEKDYCDYETCITLKELGYNQSSIAFYPCQDIIVDCVDLNGDLYEAEYDKGSLVLYSSLNNKNNDINKVKAPLLYEAQKWLREEKGIRIEIPIWLTNDGVWKYNFGLRTREVYNRGIGEWNSYEEALSEGIKEAVKILKEK